MPQFDPSGFPSQLFWLLIIFGALYWALAKRALPRIAEVLEERQDRITHDLERAEALRQEADQTREAYEAALAKAHAEGQRVIREAMQAFQEEAAKREADADAAAAERQKKAEESIAAARREAVANIKGVAVEAAQQAAERVAGIPLEADEAEKAVDAALKERAA